MKSTDEINPLLRLLRTHAMTPLEERVLAMRHGVVAALQTRLADASDGHSDLSALLKDLEQQVIHRAKVAQGPKPRGHLRVVRTPKG